VGEEELLAVQSHPVRDANVADGSARPGGSDRLHHRLLGPDALKNCVGSEAMSQLHDVGDALVPSANPMLGTQTARITVAKPGGAWADGATGGSRATSASVRSGMTVVARAMATKPWLAYRAVPAGAPAA